jgi:hypothetical protein
LERSPRTWGTLCLVSRLYLEMPLRRLCLYWQRSGGRASRTAFLAKSQEREETRKNEKKLGEFSSSKVMKERYKLIQVEQVVLEQVVLEQVVLEAIE